MMIQFTIKVLELKKIIDLQDIIKFSKCSKKSMQEKCLKTRCYD
ncbi:hypothetical protein CNEO2_940035 [Clostridium neonatale]|nr:hypothetical protein CNEO2_940035 [Clostridium neonatale]